MMFREAYYANKASMHGKILFLSLCHMWFHRNICPLLDKSFRGWLKDVVS